jgi:hypothetical protein
VPIIPAGVGVALVVVGAVLAASANSDINNLQQQWNNQCSTINPATHNTCVDLANQLNPKNNNDLTERGVGWAMIGVGGAAILGGVIWWIVKPTIGESAAAKVSVTNGPGEVGFGLKFSF